MRQYVKIRRLLLAHVNPKFVNGISQAKEKGALQHQKTVKWTHVVMQLYGVSMYSKVILRTIYVGQFSRAFTPNRMETMRKMSLSVEFWCWLINELRSCLSLAVKAVPIFTWAVLCWSCLVRWSQPSQTPIILRAIPIDFDFKLFNRIRCKIAKKVRQKWSDIKCHWKERAKFPFPQCFVWDLAHSSPPCLYSCTVKVYL